MSRTFNPGCASNSMMRHFRRHRRHIYTHRLLISLPPTNNLTQTHQREIILSLMLRNANTIHHHFFFFWGAHTQLANVSIDAIKMECVASPHHMHLYFGIHDVLLMLLLLLPLRFDLIRKARESRLIFLTGWTRSPLWHVLCHIILGGEEILGCLCGVGK